jgi:hypothetical protein
VCFLKFAGLALLSGGVWPQLTAFKINKRLTGWLMQKVDEFYGYEKKELILILSDTR